MFGNTEFKWTCKNCSQQMAKPDPLEGVGESPSPQMKAIMENTTSLVGCIGISSMPFPQRHTHAQGKTHMCVHTCAHAHVCMHTHTAHVFLHIQLLNNLQLKFNTTQELSGSTAAGLWKYALHVSGAYLRSERLSGLYLQGGSCSPMEL